MDGQEIRAREYVIERRNFDLEIARLVRRDERIVPDDLHAERARPRCHGAPDAAQADDAEGLSLQLDADEFFSFPVPFFQTLIRLRHAARQSHQQGDCVLRGSNRVAVGRIHHHDATPGSGRDVNVVHAYAGASDHAKLLRRIHQFSSDFSLAAHDQCVAIDDRRAQSIRRQADSLCQRKAGAAQRLQAAVANVVADENIHFCGSHGSMRSKKSVEISARAVPA